MKLNNDIILKIYDEFLNSDIKTKSRLRQACSFLYRKYYDPRFLEINNDTILHYFKYLLSKPLTISNSTYTNTSLKKLLFEEFQKIFSSFQNLRFHNVSSSCVEAFFEAILKEFKRHPNLMHELYSFIYPKQKKETKSINKSYNPPNESIQNSKTFNPKKKIIPFQLLYNNNDSEKVIIQSVLKLAMEQGLQRNRSLSFEDYTFQQRIAMEGLFETFYNILSMKLDRHLGFKANFMHLREFELYNCQFNYTIYVPLSPRLHTIKVVDSKVRLVIDSHLCPKLKQLIIDEDASLKLIGKGVGNFDQLETVQLRNVNFFGMQQLPQFNHLKSLRLNNYPSVNLTLPTMNDLQELFVQDNQLCDQICIKPQPNLKFLRLWNYHSCLSLVDEDIQYIYSNYGSNLSLFTPPYTHRLSTSSTTSTFSNHSTSTTSSSTSSAMLLEVDAFIDYPSYFPRVEYLRIGYCNDLFFIKQISQRISTMMTKSSAFSSTSPSSRYDTSPSVVHSTEKVGKLRRFNLLFPNLKTLVIERSCDLVDYLKWFVPTLSLLTILIFKDCHWGGNGMVPLNLENLNYESTTLNDRSNVETFSNTNQNSYDNDENKKREEEEEQEKIEEVLLRSNNLQAVLQKMRFPNTLSEIIFINCSQDLSDFIKKVLQSRHLSLKFKDIQCNEQQLKKWWSMF
ncbi:hypothetical protein BCR36DRAFT_361244 [Piromyces finnis]|uniref:RNI-like protein n=1 Tax=Piromyces finnis TaxID=1754191 RepID=A0A1Y1UXZ9_9FUNG|nr:hypothetical protein BCR36DRAFT_361244 [Piromyces finnis]|eukprot:ORX43240.1 hypothetical protein BCR36DRAFT_361244 [Piromyces finnis]